MEQGATCFLAGSATKSAAAGLHRVLADEDVDCEIRKHPMRLRGSNSPIMTTRHATLADITDENALRRGVRHEGAPSA